MFLQLCQILPFLFFFLNSNNKIFLKALRAQISVYTLPGILSPTSMWLFYLNFQCVKSRTAHFHRKIGTARGVVSLGPFLHYEVRSSCNMYLVCQGAAHYKCIFSEHCHWHLLLLRCAHRSSSTHADPPSVLSPSLYLP